MSELNYVIDTLKPLLPQYLDDQGIAISKGGSLRCINPNHDDRNSSMQLATRSDNEYCYCHSCGASYDIFNAASVLEDLPADGVDWIEENVLELASRYTIQYDTEAIHRFTHQDPRAREALRAYSHAAAMIAESKLSDNAREYINSRKWNDDIVLRFGLGSIGSYKLVQGLIASGFNSELLDEIGLTDTRLFNDNNLIFPIRNQHKKVVGFSARTFSDKLPKYVNSPSVSPYSPYHKNQILFNIDKISEFPGPLYIVEGQSDAITLWNNSMNAVALCSTTLSEEQIEILNQQSTTRLVFWLDFDQPGYEALIKRVIPTALANTLNPIPELIIPKPEWEQGWKPMLEKKTPGYDPAQYIQEYGRPNASDALVEYKPVITSYAKYLESLGDISRDVLAERLVDLVANYTSPIARSLFAAQIAEASGISQTAIYSRLDELDKLKLAKADERRQQIVSEAAKKLAREPASASQVMLNALADLEAVSHAEDNLSSTSFMSHIKDIRLEEEARTDEFPGFIIPGFEYIEKAFTGEWRGKFFIFAGSENTGKSTLSLALLMSIVSHIDNNAMLIVHATDDGLREILPKVVCFCDQLIGGGDLNYISVTNPKYGYTPQEVRQILEQRKRAYDKFFELARDERIIIKDKKDGSDLEFTKALVRYYRTRYPDRNIILLLDSVNRVRVPFMMGGDTRREITYISNTLADLAVQYDCSTAAVCEFNRPDSKTVYTKPGHITWPTNRRLAEARALEFDAKAVMLLYNDVHEKGADQASVLWRDQMGNIRPRLAVSITKNKISNIKERYFFDFHDTKGLFIPVPIEQSRADYAAETQRLLEQEEQGIKSRKSSRDRYGDDDDDNEDTYYERPRVSLARELEY